MSAAVPVAPRRFELTVALPDGRSRSVSFAPSGAIVLGRDPACDLVLPSKRVSRRHLSLEHSGESLLARDRSANGTTVDGAVLVGGERAVHDGSVLEVGPYTVTVGLRSPSPVAAPPVASHAPEAALHAAPSPWGPSGGASFAPASVPGPLRRRLHRQLLDHLDLAHLDRNHFDAETMRPRVLDALGRIIAEHRAELPAATDVEQLVAELCDEALGLGPLEELLADPAVSEIMVVDPHTIFAEKNGTIERTGQRFTDGESVRAVIERIVTPLGRRIDESTPLVDARLKDGSRVNAVIPPLAIKGPCITIRKFAKNPLTIEDLIRFGSMTESMARFLEAAVAVKKNIVISGGTGSGKTTLLNVLSASIPRAERIVTIEDAAELQLAQPHVVSLESRPPNMEGKGEYSIRDLVKNALRMRPDRIVVGECRGGEAIDMLQAMNTGHEGSMTTTHANSPREAVARLETLCLMAGLDLPVRAIRTQIASSVHLVVQQSRLGDGSRRITHVAEVGGIDDDGEVELFDLFTHERSGSGPDRFRATGYLPSFVDELVAQGFEGAGGLL